MNETHKVDCILLIDDDGISNFLTEQVIRDMRLSESIHATSEVSDALSFIKNCYLINDESKSLLIFLDLNMPVWNGFEFLDQLNQITALPFHKIDIIILTSSLAKIDQKQAKKYRILDYVVKPLTEEKVRNALKKRKIIS